MTTGRDRAGFQLTFEVGPTSLLQNILLPAGFFDPIVTRVIVIATVRGLPQVLVDGVVTRHEIGASNEPGKSTLTVTGEDLSVLMDLAEMPFMRYPAQPVSVRVLAILARYAAFGITPIVIPPMFPGTVNPLEEMPSQRGTDLAYIRELAGNAGYVFYLEPGPAPGMSLAYFGPDVRIPLPQPALAVNADVGTNVESLTFSLDGMAKKIVVLSVFDPATKKIPIPLPVPPVNVLRPPLGLRPTPPAKLEFTHEEAALDVSEAIGRALAISIASSSAITANGSLDVSRYGRPLRARLLVGVRGAGPAYDGLYYVDSVNHDIRRGAYKQTFSLSRDGLISSTPIVPTDPLGVVA
ncbi:MAG TPA: hypothetical protein VJ850_08280 [Candidatus Limnocylindrales bacterium]|nr:hypothetical protein [Candidatus Limnocylindrales bacterium]